ncbi:hypothetical protein GCM10023088_27040 [Actinomadura verrucosospora]
MDGIDALDASTVERREIGRHRLVPSQRRGSPPSAQAGACDPRGRGQARRSLGLSTRTLLDPLVVDSGVMVVQPSV